MRRTDSPPGHCLVFTLTWTSALIPLERHNDPSVFKHFVFHVCLRKAQTNNYSNCFQICFLLDLNHSLAFYFPPLPLLSSVSSSHNKTVSPLWLWPRKSPGLHHLFPAVYLRPNKGVCLFCCRQGGVLCRAEGCYSTVHAALHPPH